MADQTNHIDSSAMLSHGKTNNNDGLHTLARAAELNSPTTIFSSSALSQQRPHSRPSTQRQVHANHLPCTQSIPTNAQSHVQTQHENVSIVLPVRSFVHRDEQGKQGFVFPPRKRIRLIDTCDAPATTSSRTTNTNSNLCDKSLQAVTPAAVEKGSVEPFADEPNKISNNVVKQRISEIPLDLESLTYYPPSASTYDPVYGYDAPPIMNALTDSIAESDHGKVENDKQIENTLVINLRVKRPLSADLDDEAE